jgi:hypothetical protein
MTLPACIDVWPSSKPVRNRGVMSWPTKIRPSTLGTTGSEGAPGIVAAPNIGSSRRVELLAVERAASRCSMPARIRESARIEGIIQPVIDKFAGGAELPCAAPGGQTISHTITTVSRNVPIELTALALSSSFDI